MVDTTTTSDPHIKKTDSTPRQTDLELQPVDGGEGQRLVVGPAGLLHLLVSFICVGGGCKCEHVFVCFTHLFVLCVCVGGGGGEGRECKKRVSWIT